MDKIIEDYFQTLTRMSVHTLRSYRGSINKLREYFKLETGDQLKALKESDFIKFYNEKCGNGNTVNTHIRNLSAFFHWFFKDDYPNCAFAKTKLGGHKFDKVPRKIRAVLTKKEVEMMIEAGLNKQEKLMIALMFKTALRRGEVSNIKMVDISGCEIKITGKGGDEAHTYLNDRLCAMLKDYVENERDTDSEYLFYGVRGEASKNGALLPGAINTRIKNCAKRAGINKQVTAHTARRTAITRAAIQRSPLAAQMLGRHKNMKTTMDSYVMVGEEFVKEMLMEED